MGLPKEEARKLLTSLADDVTWDEIMYEFYVRQKIDAALEASSRGEIVGHRDAKQRFGIDED